MSITLERFLPERYPVNLDSSRKQRFVNGFNRCRTEASKVEIGLDRGKIKGIMRAHQDILDSYEEGKCSRGKMLEVLANALLAAESELIIRKEGK